MWTLQQSVHHCVDPAVLDVDSPAVCPPLVSGTGLDKGAHRGLGLNTMWRIYFIVHNMLVNIKYMENSKYKEMFALYYIVF